MVGAADAVARIGTLVAIFVSLVALYFTYTQHLRDTERRNEEKERLADERRQRNSASLTWEIVRPSLATAPAEVYVANDGADAENLRINLSRGAETLGLNPGTVRRGMSAACGTGWSIPMDAVRINWHIDAEWTDATGPRREHWHLTHLTSRRAKP